jgi:hypothetical protein
MQLRYVVASKGNRGAVSDLWAAQIWGALADSNGPFGRLSPGSVGGYDSSRQLTVVRTAGFHSGEAVANANPDCQLSRVPMR